MCMLVPCRNGSYAANLRCDTSSWSILRVARYDTRPPKAVMVGSASTQSRSDSGHRLRSPGLSASAPVKYFPNCRVSLVCCESQNSVPGVNYRGREMLVRLVCRVVRTTHKNCYECTRKPALNMWSATKETVRR